VGRGLKLSADYQSELLCQLFALIRLADEFQIVGACPMIR